MIKVINNQLELSFEHVVRSFVGNKAYGIAGYKADDKNFRENLRLCIPAMRKTVKELDTVSLHKEMLMNDIEHLNDELRLKKGGSEKDIITRLFWLVSHLLGFQNSSGKIIYQPFYHQSVGEYLRGELNKTKLDYDGFMSKHHNNVSKLQLDV